MASDFDELVERLLFDVALSGDRGLSFAQVLASIKDFYELRKATFKQPQPSGNDDLLFSSEPPATSTVIDAGFLQSTWNWLSNQPHVQAFTVDESSSSDEPTQQAGQGAPRTEFDGLPTDENIALVSHYAGQRLRTGVDRVWQAVAGHGIDSSRIKGAEFHLLVIIARHGAAGIIQPDLCKEGDQDKRSVPRRTDSLAQGGYITKLPVISHGTKTSLLKLKRYQIDETTQQSSNEPSHANMVYYDRWYATTIRLLKENSNVVSMDDLRAELSIAKEHWEVRALTRCIRRLTSTGAISRLSAKVAGKTFRNKDRYARCIQLQREPTELDRRAFTGTDVQNARTQGQDLSKGFAGSGSQQADDTGLDASEDEDDAIADLEVLEKRVAPQWTPDVPLQNFVFDMVEHAGVTGISIMELHSRGMGPLWRRPMDEMMIRLCDAWEKSQPPHLRHLSILKDTASRNKSTYFNYRTRAAFEQAVENGEAFWEAIQGKRPHSKKKQVSREPSAAEPTLDLWGFPMVPTKLLAGARDGAASLQQCVKGIFVEPLLPADFDPAAQPAVGSPRPTSTAAGLNPLPKLTQRLSAEHSMAFTAQTAKTVHAADEDKSTAGLAQAGTHATTHDEPSAPSFVVHAPASTSALNAITQPPPKKRGRPTKAMVAERERLQREARDAAKQGKQAQAQRQRETPPLDSSAHDTNNVGLQYSVADTPIGPEQVEAFSSSATNDRPSGEPATINETPAASTRRKRKRFEKLPEPVASEVQADGTSNARIQSPAIDNPRASVDNPRASVDNPRASVDNAHVCINPPGAREVKLRAFPQVGRPRKCLIAVFRSESLKSRNWHVNGWLKQGLNKGNGVATGRDSAYIYMEEKSAMDTSPLRITEAGLASARSLYRVDSDPHSAAEEPQQQQEEDEEGDRLQSSLDHAWAPFQTEDSAKRLNVHGSPPTRKEKQTVAYRKSDRASNESPDAGVTYESQDEANAVSNEQVGDSTASPDGELGVGASTRSPSGALEIGDSTKSPNRELGVTLEVPTVEDVADVPDRRQKKAGISRSSGTVQVKRTQIIMDIMRLCDGVYPGNKEIWFPVATVVSKAGGSVPDKNTVENSVKDLLSRGRLRKLTFTFRSNGGLIAKKSILTELGIDAGDPRVRKLQKKMVDLYPAQYLPNEAEVSADYRPGVEPVGRSSRQQDKLAAHMKQAQAGFPQIYGSTYSYEEEFPRNDSIVVQRTPAGLGLEAEARRQFFARNPVRAVGRPYKRRRASLDDEDEEDDEDVSDEQRRLMGHYQLGGYQHDSSHAFTERKHATARYSIFFDPAKIRTPAGTYGARSMSRPMRLPSSAQTDRLADLPSHAAHSRLDPEWLERADHETRPAETSRNVAMAPVWSASQQFGAFSQQNAPQSLNEILARSGGLLRGRPPSDKFHEQINRVAAWEHYQHTDADDSGQPKSFQFINHTQPADASSGVPIFPPPQLRRLQSLGSSLWNLTGHVRSSLLKEKPRLAGLSVEKRDTTPRVKSYAFPGYRKLVPAGDAQENTQQSAPAPSSQDHVQQAASAPRGLKRVRFQEEADQEEVQVYKERRKYKTRAKHKAALGLEPGKSNGRPRTAAVAQASRSTEANQGPTYMTSKKRDRRSSQLFEENDRLANAVALYRALCGGLDQRSNWGIIAHMLFFKYEPEFLRRRWDGMKSAREEGVRKLMERIYAPFLAAYESGEVPTIDFGNVNRTDWAAMLKWLEEKVLVPGEAVEVQLPKLPQSTSDFHDEFAVNETPTLWEPSKDTYFTCPIDKTRRDVVHEFVYGNPLPGLRRPSTDRSGIDTVLKSWVRAIATTKLDRYNASLAAHKIRAFGDQAVKAICDEMVSDKFLRHVHKGRQQPGRNFEIHDYTWGMFRRWPGRTSEFRYLRDVVAARQEVLDRLQHGDSWVLSFHELDPHILVLTNMVDQGLLRMTTQLPERNDDFEAPFPRLTALSYSGYSYNAKTMDRSRLRFPITYEKTDKFTTEHGLKGGLPVPLGVPAGSQLDDGRIPFWVDIHGNLIDDVWDLVLRSVLHVVLFRPGCTARSIEKSHSHRLFAWEVGLVLEWMEKTAVVVRLETGVEKDGVLKGGWRAGEWWYCVFSPDIAIWKTPGL